MVPSYSEVIGMVNLEASACKTPVITTHQTGLSKEFANNGGVLLNPNLIELKAALQNSLSWNKNERVDRGNLLQKFIFEHYSWEKKGHLWSELYGHFNS